MKIKIYLTLINFSGSLILVINIAILETSNFYKEKLSSKIAFKIKSWKNVAETSFKTNKYTRANYNFCLVNYKRMRMKQFHLHTNVNYYTAKCRLQHQSTFYGFQSGHLVEVVKCPFYVHAQKWTFEKLLEKDEDDAIVDVRKLELYSFENHWNSLQKLRSVDFSTKYSQWKSFVLEL